MSVYKRTVRGKISRNYSFDYIDETGRSRTESSRRADKRHAERMRRERADRARAVREGLVDPGQERLRKEADKIDDYLESCDALGQAVTGLREKRRHLTKWFLPAVGEATRLNDIRADAFDLRLKALTDAKKSARTVNLKLEVPRAFLNW